MNTALSRATPALSRPDWNPEPQRSGPGERIGPKKILVVDDNIVFLKAMSLKLRTSGYEVITAVDGASAVSSVRKLKPDLILLDLNFPPTAGASVGMVF
jgi:response regulator RpfG family c-di-GMP phosphodiesterase